MPRPDQQDVALSHPHSLGAPGLIKISREHALARLQPVHVASARHVEQDAAPDKSVLHNLDRLDRCTGGRHRVRRPSVVQGAVVGDVAEGVEVAVRVVVIVDPDVVLSEGEAAGLVLGAEHRHAVVGGLGVIGLALGVKDAAEADRLPAARQAGGGGDPLGASNS